MQYVGLAIVVALLAFIVALVALRVLVGGNWLLGWLRGTVGMLVLVLAGFIGLIAWDLTTYRSLPDGAPLASLLFKADGPQRYQVALVEAERTKLLTLEGDLWQVELREIRWKGLAALIGLEPGYRLQSLSGRYLAVEQQDKALQPDVELAHSRGGIDFWSWLQDCRCGSMLLEARARRITYLPMTDGAKYNLEMAPTGLLAKPANAAAEHAMTAW
jgi:hypothetical protein